MSNASKFDMIKPVIVGAGPAGIRAAQTLVSHGLRPTVLDESPSWGGQIYRQPSVHFKRTKKELYGFEAGRADSVHQAMAEILDRVDYHPDTLVWNAQDNQLDTLSSGKTSVSSYSHLILATGATDRVLPFEGWTLPGVYSLGAAQIALKAQGNSIGDRVVLMGTGPLLYLVAYQYVRAGANVVAVLDTSKRKSQVAATGSMLSLPSVLLKGVYYIAWLRAHGVPLFEGINPIRASGHERVTGIVWEDDRGNHEISCDAIGFGYALRSETQLADILGCRFSFDRLQRAHLPERDECGRSSIDGVYLAGDGAGIMGADAAEKAGELVALTLISDAQPSLIQEKDRTRMKELQSELSRIKRFRLGLEQAFPFPQNWANQTPDDLMICRCEEISAGQIRQAVQVNGAIEINRVKALTRVGMGRCQSRMCAAAAAEIIADCAGIDISEVGRLRGQPPIKPIPFVTEQQTGETQTRDKQ